MVCISDNKLKVVIISTHLPRQCGIATFTEDLCNILKRKISKSDELSVVALEPSYKRYSYPNRVKLVIREDFTRDYLDASSFINKNEDIVL